MNTIVGVGAWPASSSLPILNAQNLMFADSLHFTQHRQKLASAFFVSWFSPLPLTKCRHSRKCKCKTVLKKKTTNITIEQNSMIVPNFKYKQ